MAGSTPDETARRFLEGDLRTRLELSAGPLRELMRIRLRVSPDAPAREAQIRELRLVHADDDSAIVMVDADIVEIGSVSGPLTLERSGSEWKVIDYSPFGVRVLEGIASRELVDAQEGARAVVTLLYRGPAGVEGEVVVESSGPQPLELRHVWLGFGRRWIGAYAIGPSRVDGGGAASLVVARAARRPPDMLVVETSRDPFVLDLRGTGRHELPRSFRWSRSRWHYAVQLLPALAALPLFGVRGAAIVLVGLAALIALHVRHERGASTVRERPDGV